MIVLRSLGTRIAVPAGFFVLVSVACLSVVLIRAQRELIFAEVVQGSESIAEALSLSIDHDMRVNHGDGVRDVISTVGTHSGIVGIRLFNKDGRISFSSDEEEVGDTVSTDSDACASCHSGAIPLATLDPENRSRVYGNGSGERVLATIHVIRNQEGCAGADCHASPARQSVLGVLDVAVSLAEGDARVASATQSAALISLAAVALITAVLFLLVRRSVRRPIRRLVAATRQAAGGTPSVDVPRGAAHEFRVLASSVNEMIEGLSSSRAELAVWSDSLEHKLKDKALELRDAQFQVAQAEKLSSVGLVAAGIAHELNSPLMAIITFTHLVKQAVGENEQASADLRMIEGEANRCAAIIRQLLDFARQQSTDPEIEACSVGESLRGVTELLKVEFLNAEVDVHVTEPEEVAAVEANRVQLMQVFVNLALNAVHAMPEGGRLYIDAAVVDRAEYAEVGLPPHASPRLVRVTVRDTGVGIPAEDLPRVFDPFFTTKPVGQGSGLGLSVSLGLVGRYRGTILVNSEVGVGSEFVVLLPLYEATESIAA